MKVWLTSADEKLVASASTALWTQLGLQRKKWKPALHDGDVEKIKRISPEKLKLGRSHAIGASLLVAFHAGTVWSDDVLFSKLNAFRKASRSRAKVVEAMLKQLKPNFDKRSGKRIPRKPRK